MLNVPPEIREAWPEPNYNTPETRGPALIVVIVIFHTIATGMVLLRCYTRLKITYSFGLDDKFIIISMVPATGMAAVAMVANIQYGWDRHIWDLEPDKFKPGIKIGLTCSILFALTSTFTKISLLAFYNRLLTQTTPAKYKWAIRIIGFLSAVLAVVFIFQLSFSCSPTHAYWDFAPPNYEPTYEYNCHNRADIMFNASIVNVVLEFLTMLVPIPIIWQLSLPKRQRLAVIAIFGLGFVVCVAGALKTHYVHTGIGESYDEQWDVYPLWILTIVEADVGLICASAPALKPFVGRYLPQVFGPQSAWTSRHSARGREFPMSSPTSGKFGRMGMLSASIKRPQKIAGSTATAIVYRSSMYESRNISGDLEAGAYEIGVAGTSGDDKLGYRPIQSPRSCVSVPSPCHSRETSNTTDSSIEYDPTHNCIQDEQSDIVCARR